MLVVVIAPQREKLEQGLSSVPSMANIDSLSLGNILQQQPVIMGRWPNVVFSW
jgi:hypothetical protein